MLFYLHFILYLVTCLIAQDSPEAQDSLEAIDIAEFNVQLTGTTVDYTVDGIHDCTTNGTECTSLNQAFDRIDISTEVALYNIYLASDISDTTERSICATKSLSVQNQKNATVTITNATASTHVFMTLGTGETTAAFEVTITGLQFLFLSTNDQYGLVTGPLFETNATNLPTLPISLILKKVIFTTGHETGQIAYTSCSIIRLYMGKLTLDAVQASYIHTLSEGLISVTGGHLHTLHRCQFTNISQLNDTEEAKHYGGVFSIEAYTGSVIDATSMTFVSCFSGYAGGGMNVLISGHGTVTVGDMDYDTEIGFKSCGAGHYGGALYFDQTVNQDLTINRIEYADCYTTAVDEDGELTMYGINLFYCTRGDVDFDYYLELLGEVLKYQLPQGPDFIIELPLDPTNPTELADVPMSLLTSAFGNRLTLDTSSGRTCVLTTNPDYENIPVKPPGMEPGQAGTCPSLTTALEITNKAALPIGSFITIGQKEMTIQNFQGTASRHATVNGEYATITLTTTTQLDNPLITIGPGESDSTEINDRDIIVTLREFTVRIQRTDAVFLRKSLFKIDNRFLIRTRTDAGTTTTETRTSNALHCLLLESVRIESGNEYTVEEGGIPLAATQSPIIEANDGTVIVLQNTTFLNLKILTSVDLGALLYNSLISCPAGTFILMSSTFENIVSQSAPLFAVSPADRAFGMELPTTAQGIHLDTVNVFRNITLESGNGTILRVDLTPSDTMDKSFSLTNAYFSQCKALDGYGGVLYVSNISNPSQLSFQDLSFSGCDAIYGSNMYVVTDSFDAAAAAAQWVALETETVMNEDYQLSTSLGQSVPIFDHTSVEDTIMVDVQRGDDAGVDGQLCGTAATVPCKTIYMGYINRNPHTTTIVMSAGVYRPDTRPVSITSTITITGGAPSSSFVKKPVGTVEGGTFNMPNTVSGITVVFQLITFFLLSGDDSTGTPTALSAPAMNCECEGVLQCTDVQFLFSQDIPQQLPIDTQIILATAGELILTDCTFANLDFASGRPCIDTYSSAKLRLVGCTFNNITTATRPLLYVNSICEDLVFEAFGEKENSFTDITRMQGDGAVLGLELGGIYGLNLSHASFTNCVCNETDALDPTISLALAGAICITLIDKTGTFIVDPDSVTFEGAFSVPYESAITFTGTDVSVFWTTPKTKKGADNTDINYNSYAYNLTQYDSEWTGLNAGRYYIFVMETSTKVSCNNTVAYSMTNHPSIDAFLIPLGGDVPGCGHDPSLATSIPCFSVEQAYANVLKAISKHALEGVPSVTLIKGTYSGKACANTIITSPVTITGSMERGKFKTYITVDEDCFYVSCREGEVVIRNFSITATAGGFIANHGSCTVSFKNSTVSGVPNPTPAQRLTTSFITSTAGTLKIEDVAFSTILLHGPQFIVTNGTTLKVNRSSFVEIRGRSPGTGGGAIHSEVTTHTPTLITDTDFIACQTQTNGGGLWTDITSSGEIHLTNVILRDCVAVGYGGGIYYNLYQRWTVLNRTNVDYQGADNDADAGSGVYLFIHARTDNSFLKYSDVEAVVKKYRLVNGQFTVIQPGMTSPINFYELQPYIVIGGNNTSEDDDCGTADKPCSTLENAVTSNTYNTSTLLWLAAANIEPSTIPLRVSKPLILKGHSTTFDDETVQKSTVKVQTIEEFEEDGSYTAIMTCFSNDPENDQFKVEFTEIDFGLVPSLTGDRTFYNRFLLVTEGVTLMIDNVRFQVYDPSVEIILQSFFVDTEEANGFEVYDTVFSTLTIEDGSLLRIPITKGRNFDVKTTCVFENIYRRHGNGSVMGLPLTDRDELEFSNVIFRNCSCGDGYGGAIYVTADHGRLIIGDETDPETGDFNPTQFINCSSSYGGGALFVDFLDMANPPSTDRSTDGDLFILQNLAFTEVPQWMVEQQIPGRYALAHGRFGVVNTIKLWKDMIKLSNTTGEFEYYIVDWSEDIKDQYAKALNNVYEVIPALISVVNIPEDATEEERLSYSSETCIQCATIRAALNTYGAFATRVQIEFETRVSVLNAVMDHTVILQGTGANIIYIPITDDVNSVFLNVTGKRIEVEFTKFTLSVNSSVTGKRFNVRPVLVTDQASLTLTTMTFSDVTPSPTPCSASIVTATDGKLKLNGVTFDKIIMGAQPLLDVSTDHDAFSMSGSNLFNIIQTQTAQPYYKGTIFTLVMESGAGILIGNARFSSCVSSPHGALFHFTIFDAPDDGTLVFENINFTTSATEPTAQFNANTNRNAIVQCSLTDFMETSGQIWTGLFNHQTYDKDTFLYIPSTDTLDATSEAELMALAEPLADYRYYHFYVDNTSTLDDPTQCNEATPCPYLHYAADLANAYLVEEVRVSVAKGTLDNSQMKATFLRSVNVTGYVSDEGVETTLHVTTESTGSLALITVGIAEDRLEAVEAVIKNFNVIIRSVVGDSPYVPVFGVVSQFSLPARLILETMTFTIDTDIPESMKHDPLQTTIVHAAGGCLTINNTHFSNFIIEDNPILTVKPKTVTEGVESTTDFQAIDNNTFTNNTRKTGNGCILSIDLQENGDFVLANSSYNGNSAPLGGVLFLSVAADVENASFFFDPTTLVFVLPGTYENGAYLYVHIENMNYLSSDYTAMLSNTVVNTADTKYLYVLDIKAGSYLDEYQFYETHEDALIVSENPGDYNRLADAIDALKTDPNARRIFLKRDLVYPPQSQELLRDLSISGLFDDRSRAYVPLPGLTEALYTVRSPDGTVSVAFNDLAFHISSTPETPVTAPIFVTFDDLATLFLASCTFQPQEGAMTQPLVTPLINAFYGTFAVSKCSFSNFVLQDCSLFTLPTFLNKFGVYARCTITNITRNVGDGAVFHETVEASDILNVENMEFNNCVAKNGNGGVASFTLRFRSGFTTSNLAFINCAAQGTSSTTDGEASKGGALHITLTGDPTRFSFTDTSLSGCSASEGRSFFIDYTGATLPSEETLGELMASLTGVKEGDVMASVLVDEKVESKDLFPYLLLVEQGNTTTTSTESDKKGINPLVIILPIVAAVAIVVAVIIFIVCSRKKNE